MGTFQKSKQTTNTVKSITNYLQSSSFAPLKFLDIAIDTRWSVWFMAAGRFVTARELVNFFLFFFFFAAFKEATIHSSFDPSHQINIAAHLLASAFSLLADRWFKKRPTLSCWIKDLKRSKVAAPLTDLSKASRAFTVDAHTTLPQSSTQSNARRLHTILHLQKLQPPTFARRDQPPFLKSNSQ